jgi:ABC-type branched-subunit amino acid transport system substrate-binding protein
MTPPGVTTLVLGAVMDQASASAYYSWPSSAKLAIDQINEGLTMAGTPLRVRLDLSDSAQDANVATMKSLEVVRSRGARALVVDTSRNAIAVTKMMYDADPANDLNVPVVCVTCTAPNLNDPMAVGTDDIDTATLRDAAGWSFRTCNRATEQTSVLQRVILSRGTNGDVNGDGKFKIAILVLDDNSGHGFVKSTQKLFADVNSGVIVEKIVLPGPAIDINNATFWDSVASKLVDDNSDCLQDPANANACLPAVMGDGEPDVIMENLNPGYNIGISRALTRAGNHITFFHAHAFRAPQTAEILRNAVNGQQGVCPVLYDDTPSGMKFASDMHTALGRGPALLDSSVYDATVSLSLALVKAARALPDPSQVTGAQVRDALGQLNDPAAEMVGVGAAEFAKAFQKFAAGAPINYDGASGPVDFDANGNVWVKLSLYAGVDGAFVDMQKFDCVHDHACPAISP